MKIVGITGTIGAGKGTIVNYLIKEYGFHHYSVREYLIKEIIRRDLPVNRDTMVQVANNLRADHNPAFIVDELYREAADNGINAVIESIRTAGEIESLRKKGEFILLAINADAKIRYDRIVERNSETDQISFATFLDNEKREMSTTDPNKQNLSACIGQADFVLLNNEGFDELYHQVNNIMNQLYINKK